MNTKTIIGYVLAIIGLIGLALTFEPIQKIAKITLPPQISNLYLTTGSVIILLIGVFLVFKSGGGSSGKVSEVPIYHGKNIVGYRRH